jgi:hypothetical protein
VRCEGEIPTSDIVSGGRMEQVRVNVNPVDYGLPLLYVSRQTTLRQSNDFVKYIFAFWAGERGNNRNRLGFVRAVV